MESKTPVTLQQAIQHFGDYKHCHDFMVSLRWPDGVVRCPRCGSEHVKYLEKARAWKCYGKHDHAKFSLKTNTIFEDSPIGLEKWLPVAWMIVNCRNGVSSWEIHRAFKVTQKTAWFMLHRIRLAMKADADPKSMGGPDGGEVEVDETMIGPNLRRMNAKRRKQYDKAQAEAKAAKEKEPWAANFRFGKTTLQGVLDRKAKKIRAVVVPNEYRETLMAAILENVAHGSRVYTDEHSSYRCMDEQYVHQMVNHMERYVDGRVHVNGVENFWSGFKRTLRGTYTAVEPFHLERYADEASFRFNHRKDGDRKLSDCERFSAALSQIVGRRITYAQLTGKEGETQAF